MATKLHLTLSLLLVIFCLGCDPQYGKVVNKEFVPQHDVTVTTPTFDGRDVSIETHTETVDDAYFLVLTGTNSTGQAVEFKKEVTPEQFVQTKIGQYWPPAEQ